MEVARVGFTPVKGGRHTPYDSAQLADSGAVGDRRFCLVDPARARVLRTIENPSLTALRWRWDGTHLALDGPGGSCVGQPSRGPAGESLTVDYWGRPTAVDVVDGPWSAVCSAHLGYDVVLVRAPAGAVVYGDAVTVLTTESLRGLAALPGLDHPAGLAERFRSTLVIDTGPDVEGPERTWVGSTLQVGPAALEITGRVPRCAVIDLDPATGRRDVRLLAALAAAQSLAPGEEPWFGVQARVAGPGRVAVGDTVRAG